MTYLQKVKTTWINWQKLFADGTVMKLVPDRHKKMYNSVQSKYLFQQYIWHNDLDKRKLPDEKKIKTLIYGVKSNGNQSERIAWDSKDINCWIFRSKKLILFKTIYMLMTVCQVKKKSRWPLTLKRLEGSQFDPTPVVFRKMHLLKRG